MPPPRKTIACKRTTNIAKPTFFHGLAVQAAEATANYLTHIVQGQLSIPQGRGKRYSWGYPACPELADHEIVLAPAAATGNRAGHVTDRILAMAARAEHRRPLHPPSESKILQRRQPRPRRADSRLIQYISVHALHQDLEQIFILLQIAVDTTRFFSYTQREV